MKQTDPHFKLRIPADLKATLESSAKMSQRSMSAEIVARLRGSVSADNPELSRETALLLRQLSEAVLQVAEGGEATVLLTMKKGELFEPRGHIVETGARRRKTGSS